MDAEIKVPSVKNPELTNVLPLKQGVSQNIAVHALPTVRKVFLVLIYTFQVFLSFGGRGSPNPLPTFELCYC